VLGTTACHNLVHAVRTNWAVNHVEPVQTFLRPYVPFAKAIEGVPAPSIW
jgi:hypothetical protein